MMVGIKNKQSLLASFWRDNAGNFGMMTAILLPVALASAGMAMDLTRMVQVRSELQNATDAAALAAASAMSGKGISEEDAAKLAKEFLATQLANLFSGQGMTSEDIANMEDAIKDAALFKATETQKGSAKTYDVTIHSAYELGLNPLSGLLGFKTVTLEAESSAQSATESKNALSMFLVLDKSGSMAWITDTINTSKKKCKNYTQYNWGWNIKETSPCYVTKIEALKVAVAGLTAQLDEADPDDIYVRTAAVSYDSWSQPATTLEWGTTSALNYVKALEAEGGTASTQAFKAAHSSLAAATEDAAHKAKNGQVPSKYIVLMTDGDNNNTSDDTKTLELCTTAKAQKMEIFSVAFMAPSRGQALLKSCATSTNHYYDAKDAEELVAAFQQIGEKASQAMTRLTH